MAFLAGKSRAHGNVDVLLHFTVWTLNRHLISRDSGNALQSRNQIRTGCGFGHEPMSPQLHPGLEYRTIVDCQEHYLCGGRDSPYLVGGCNTIHDGHVDVHEDYFRL